MKIPSNLDTERSILGLIIADSSCLVDIAEVTLPEHFSVESHAAIYKTLLDMMMAKKSIDLITVSAECAIHGIPVGYIAELTDTHYLSSHALSYSTILKKEYERRKLFTMAHDVLREIKENTSNDEIMTKVMNDVFSLSGETRKIKHVKQVLKTTFDAIQVASEHKGMIGKPTGLRKLDEITAGYQNGDFWVIAARPGIGKSALAMLTATNASDNEPVLVFQLEMSDEQIGVRLLSGLARIDGRELKAGKFKESVWHKLHSSADVLCKKKLYIDDCPSQTELSIWTAAKKFKAKYGLGMVVIDYIQLMKSSEPKNNREQEVAQISRGLKLIAKDLHVPVIALAQLSRKCEEQKRRPVLSDLRESGSIEQDADGVIFLHYPYKYDENMPRTLVEAIIDKNRGGPTGVAEINWEREFTLFSDREENYFGD